ncbi:diaminopimelate decarboxylase [Chloroflexota bacterium]
MKAELPRLCLFPQTAEVGNKGHLNIGGCDTAELAATFGTPLYVFDETALRNKCIEFRHEYGRRYPDTLVIYACKAFINPALASILKEEGLGLDVVSAGELGIARSIDFPSESMFFHGNNKSREELREALEWGIGRIVVDNFLELQLLSEIAKEKNTSPNILLRLSPGVDPHTHSYTTTGILDSKFGFPIITGQAEEAVSRATADPNLNLVGLHCHLGSPIFEMEPYQKAIEIMFRFAAEMKEKYDFELKEFSPGGGFAIQYVLDSPAPSTGDYAEAITSAVIEQSKVFKLIPPRLIVEPGRAIVGQAGVALYRFGAAKEIPGIRKYVFVDGGMGDNIRPALYGSEYEALVANKAGEAEVEQVTIAGKFCESGDKLIKDISLPKIEEGDILAMPDCGAYALSMASNYNAFLKPAVVLVNEGKARLIRRRETCEDLVRCDLF